MINQIFILSLTIIFSFIGCQKNNNSLDVKKKNKCCAAQAAQNVNLIAGNLLLLRTILTGTKDWQMVGVQDWTSGFWPGIHWYLYETTGYGIWKLEAEKYTRFLLPLYKRFAKNFDFGFMIYSSACIGYRLTNNPEYKTALNEYSQ